MTDEEEYDAWWTLCSGDPIDAIKLPLFALIALAEPEKYAQFEKDRAQRWVDEHLEMLTDAAQREFAIECCQHARFETALDGTLPLNLVTSSAAWAPASRLPPGTDDDIWQETVDQEHLWQWRRLLQYISQDPSKEAL